MPHPSWQFFWEPFHYDSQQNAYQNVECTFFLLLNDKKNWIYVRIRGDAYSVVVLGKEKKWETHDNGHSWVSLNLSSEMQRYACYICVRTVFAEAYIGTYMHASQQVPCIALFNIPHWNKDAVGHVILNISLPRKSIFIFEVRRWHLRYTQMQIRGSKLTLLLIVSHYISKI